jgi:hypothetical protein
MRSVTSTQAILCRGVAGVGRELMKAVWGLCQIWGGESWPLESVVQVARCPGTLFGIGGPVGGAPKRGIMDMATVLYQGLYSTVRFAEEWTESQRISGMHSASRCCSAPVWSKQGGGLDHGKMPLNHYIF